MDDVASAPLAAARTRLGIAIVRRLLAATPADNVFISPHSLAGALAVVQAAGVVEAESIGELLASSDPATHAELSRALADPDPDAVELRMAQSLWTDLRIGFEHADAVHTHFPDVEWRARDFGADATVEEINRWAHDNTDGLIDRIIEGLLEDERLAVLDAILFVGTWTHPFDTVNTRSAPFTTASGRRAELPLMELDAARVDLKLPYAEGDGWQAVRLPYGSGRLGLLVVLGAPGVPPAALLERLDVDAVLAGMQPREGVVRIPRFRVDASSDLLDHLEALGLRPPSDPQLEEGGLRISRILQRAVLEVDEEGTRAAAVTFIGAQITSVGPPPFDFTADRPFLCAIHDRDTGSLLFVGAVQDPEPIPDRKGETHALPQPG